MTLTKHKLSEIFKQAFKDGEDPNRHDLYMVVPPSLYKVIKKVMGKEPNVHIVKNKKVPKK